MEHHIIIKERDWEYLDHIRWHRLFTCSSTNLCNNIRSIHCLTRRKTTRSSAVHRQHRRGGWSRSWCHPLSCSLGCTAKKRKPNKISEHQCYPFMWQKVTTFLVALPHWTDDRVCQAYRIIHLSTLPKA